jgi:hypothetical protein
MITMRDLRKLGFDTAKLPPDARGDQHRERFAPQRLQDRHLLREKLDVQQLVRGPADVLPVKHEADEELVDIDAPAHYVEQRIGLDGGHAVPVREQVKVSGVGPERDTTWRILMIGAVWERGLRPRPDAVMRRSSRSVIQRSLRFGDSGSGARQRSMIPATRPLSPTIAPV